MSFSSSHARTSSSWYDVVFLGENNIMAQKGTYPHGHSFDLSATSPSFSESIEIGLPMSSYCGRSLHPIIPQGQGLIGFIRPQGVRCHLGCYRPKVVAETASNGLHCDTYMTSVKIIGILDPSPLSAFGCKSTQPPLFHPLFHYPPPASRQISIAPYMNTK